MVFAFLKTFFFRHFFAGFGVDVVFINVYKHRGSKIGKTSQGLDPRSKIQDSGKNFLDPQRNLASDPLSSDPRSFSWNLGSWILDPDLGSKKFFLESWILDLGSRPWIQEVFPRILDLGSWIQTLDPISFFCRSIVFINVYKHLETCQNPPCPEKGFREGPKYWKIQISPDPSHVWTLHLLSKLPYTFSRVNFQDFCNISLNWISS